MAPSVLSQKITIDAGCILSEIQAAARLLDRIDNDEFSVLACEAGLSEIDASSACASLERGLDTYLLPTSSADKWVLALKVGCGFERFMTAARARYGELGVEETAAGPSDV